MELITNSAKPGYCRVDGCPHMARASLTKQGHKANTRKRVLCRKHAGIRNLISKEDYQKVRASMAVKL